MAANVAPQIPPLPKGRFDWEHRGEWIEDPTAIVRTVCAKYSGRPKSPEPPSRLVALSLLVLGVTVPILGIWAFMQFEGRDVPPPSYPSYGVGVENIYADSLAVYLRESSELLVGPSGIGPPQVAPQ